MSETFSLVCHETRQTVWIGQGWGSMSSFYRADLQAMSNLQAFLNATRGKSLEFVNNGDGWHDACAEYEEFVAPAEDREPGDKIDVIVEVAGNRKGLSIDLARLNDTSMVPQMIDKIGTEVGRAAIEMLREKIHNSE